MVHPPLVITRWKVQLLVQNSLAACVTNNIYILTFSPRPKKESVGAYLFDICRSLGWLWSRWRNHGLCWNSYGWRRTLALRSTGRYLDMAPSHWVPTTFGRGKMLGRSSRFYLKASPGYLKSRSSFFSIRLLISSICGSRVVAIWHKLQCKFFESSAYYYRLTLHEC